MNNRKLIYAVITLVVIFWLVLFLIISKVTQNTKTTPYSYWDFNIWIVWDSETKFTEFLSTFKNDNRSVSNISYNVTSFKTFKDYSIALKSAIIKWVAPDIFILNNNETSIFEELILEIPNSSINIYNFRKKYKTIFSTDLIIKKWETISLKWIPVWYETLWIFYNKRYRLKPFNFISMSSLLSAISKIEKFWVVPIAIGNWSTILNAWDILAQFFLLNKINSLEEAKSWKISETLSEFFAYWSWDNNYNSLIEYWDNNIDLFVDKKVASIIAYPRIIEELKEKWFSNKFLAAAAFPHYFPGDGYSLANYNYFVINKNTKQKEVALIFLQYLNSEKWAQEYLNKFNYYLPAQLKLEEKLKSKKISDFYDNIQLRDFYSNEPLSSFNKWNKIIYDEKIIPILDNFNSSLIYFNKFQKYIICNTNKILYLKDLYTSCK